MLRTLTVAVSAALAATLFAAPCFSKDAVDGKKLYAKYCGNCHGQVSKSDVKGATPEEIKFAMTGRMCGESGGNRLTGAELDAIARALSGKDR